MGNIGVLTFGDIKIALNVIEPLAPGFPASLVTDSGEWHTLISKFKEVFKREYNLTEERLKKTAEERSTSKMGDEILRLKYYVNDGQRTLTTNIGLIKSKKDQSYKVKEKVFEILAFRLASLLAIAKYGLASPYAMIFVSTSFGDRYKRGMEETVEVFAENLKNIGLNTTPIKKQLERLIPVLQLHFRKEKGKDGNLVQAMQSKLDARLEAFLKELANKF